jgi:hypothetical protein
LEEELGKLNYIKDTNEQQNKYTIKDGITKLEHGTSNITKNKKLDEKNDINHWCFLCSIAILRYLQLLDKNIPKMVASAQVATVIYNKSSLTSYKSTCIRSWANYFLLTGELPTFKQGAHTKISSIIFNPSNQSFLKGYLRSLSDNDHNPTKFYYYLNNTLLKQIGYDITISTDTARRWMQFLGFKKDDSKKGYYNDEHNRTDIVDYRNNEVLLKFYNSLFP